MSVGSFEARVLKFFESSRNGDTDPIGNEAILMGRTGSGVVIQRAEDWAKGDRKGVYLAIQEGLQNNTTTGRFKGPPHIREIYLNGRAATTHERRVAIAAAIRGFAASFSKIDTSSSKVATSKIHICPSHIWSKIGDWLSLREVVVLCGIDKSIRERLKDAVSTRIRKEKETLEPAFQTAKVQYKERVIEMREVNTQHTRKGAEAYFRSIMRLQGDLYASRSHLNKLDALESTLGLNDGGRSLEENVLSLIQ